MSDPRAASAHSWPLPACGAGCAQGRPAPRHTPRNWIVDGCCFLFAAGFGYLESVSMVNPESIPKPQLAADYAAWVVGCSSLWLRRRWPVALAVFLLALSTFSMLVPGAVLVALFTVAVHRPFPVTAAIGAAGLATTPIYPLLRPDPGVPFGLIALFGMSLIALAMGWGMFVRSRRQFVVSLYERALHAEHRAQLHAERAQQQTRAQMAREMHDVLGHRLALLSLHAGVMEFRSDSPAHEIEQVAKQIRENAHLALEDLRDIIGVLRGSDPGADDGSTDQRRPQRTLADIPALVAEHQGSGMRVTLDERVGDTASIPASISLGVYWIVQEALINAGKHALGAEVRVTVERVPAGLGTSAPGTGAPGADGPGTSAPGAGDRGTNGLGTSAPGTGGLSTSDPGVGGSDTSAPGTADRSGPPGLEVTVVNDPAPGTAGPIPGAKMGLIGLAERISLLGGHFTCGQTRAGGFRVHAWLPCAV